MLGTKLLFLSLVVYVSGQGVSYYGGSNIRNQNPLPPRLPGSYTSAYKAEPNTEPIKPVYNPQPVYQSPQPVQPIYQPPQYVQPDGYQLSPVQRPPQFTYGPHITDPPEYDPKPALSPALKTNEAVANEIPPQPIYSPIPPQPTMPPQPARQINGYPRPLQPWSWRSVRPTEAPVEVIQENKPDFGPIAVDVESPIEPAPSPALVEELTVELQPEAELDVSSSAPEGSQSDNEVKPQPELLEPAKPKPLPEIKLPTPRPSLQSYPDLRPIQEEPSTDTIPELLNYPEPIPISNQQTSDEIQPEPLSALYPTNPIPRPLPPLVPRPFPSPGQVISSEPQQIAPEPAISVQPSIESAFFEPSYQPTELGGLVGTAPVLLSPKPNYQPVLPTRPSYQQPALIPVPVSRPPQPLPASQPPAPSYEPLQPPAPIPISVPTKQPEVSRPDPRPPQPLPLLQPLAPNYQPLQPVPAPIPVPIPPEPQLTPTYPVVPPTPDIQVPAPDVLPIIPIADFQCSKGNAYHTIINECDAYIKCQRQRAWKETCPDGLHFNPRASYPEYPCAYPSEVKCESTASKQAAQPTNQCPNRYGFFAISGGDCSKYLMCQEGKSTLMNCPFGLVFNDQLSSCDWPENVPQCNLSAFKDFACPIPPEDDPDLLTRFRYGNDCILYVACQRGHPRLLRCDSGLSFDENSQVCIDSDLVEDCRSKETLYYSKILT